MIIQACLQNLSKKQLLSICLSPPGACKENGCGPMAGTQLAIMRKTILTKLNQTHLGHNYPTDVLTFDYSSGNQIHAEVFVCEQVVKSNAAELNEPFLKELHRVVLHGLLHLLGHNDKTPEERKNIRSLEDKYLKEL